MDTAARWALAGGIVVLGLVLGWHLTVALLAAGVVTLAVRIIAPPKTKAWAGNNERDSWH